MALYIGCVKFILFTSHFSAHSRFVQFALNKNEKSSWFCRCFSKVASLVFNKNLGQIKSNPKVKLNVTSFRVLYVDIKTSNTHIQLESQRFGKRAARVCGDDAARLAQAAVQKEVAQRPLSAAAAAG